MDTRKAPDYGLILVSPFHLQDSRKIAQCLVQSQSAHIVCHLVFHDNGIIKQESS